MVHNVYSSDEHSQFSIRLKMKDRDYLHAEARKNNRSLNAEISQRLAFTIEHEYLIEDRDVELAVSQMQDKVRSGAYSDEGEIAVQLQQVSHKIDRLQNYLDSESFSVRLFKQALSYFSKK